MGSGKFLGYMITTRGIEVNPNQITAIQWLHLPNNPKEVQKLMSMIAALNRFVLKSADKEFQWKVFVYRASNARGSGVEIVLVSPKGVKLERSLRLGFWALNNEAKYEALIVRLQAAKFFGAKEVEMFSDSMVSQIEGSFKAKDRRMS